MASKWQTSGGTKLFLFLLFFSFGVLLLQHHLAMMSVLNRHLAAVWSSKYSPELNIFVRKQIQEQVQPIKAAPQKSEKLSRDNNPPVFGNETWHQMDNYHVILLKSVAFIDRRYADKTPTLRMLLYKNHGLQHNGACLIQDPATLEWTEISGKFTLINLVSPKCPGGCAWRYEAYYFDCPLHVAPPVGVKLKLVTVGLNVTREYSAAITHIRESKPVENPEHELAVCAKALYKYNVWLRLMLFIEVYKHLGINHN